VTGVVARTWARRRGVPLVARLMVVAVLAIALAACSSIGGGGGNRITVTGDFADVNALEHDASVVMNGVTVGFVKHVTVDGNLAKLTMSLRQNAYVPADVTPVVGQQSLLGPDVVELLVPAGDKAGPLRDHAVIADAAHPGRFQADLETLVKSGTDLLGTLGAEGTTALAQVIAENAQGFGPEGGDLRVVLDDLNTVLGGYATRTQTINTLLDNLDTFASNLGPNAQANAQALTNLANATAVLDRQKDRLLNLLSSLSSVSTEGHSLLSADLREITDQLTSLNTVTKGVANQQAALGQVLKYVNGHNLSTARSVHSAEDFVQVLNDFIVCGLPGGGEVATDPLNSCSYVPQAARP
jgi:phospholipid/cholesterol/gamma-HCH transport system substrate-binding protein